MTYRILEWYKYIIYTYISLILMVNVGRIIPYMAPMGEDDSKSIHEAST